MTCMKCNGRIWYNGRVGNQHELSCLSCGKLVWVVLNNPFGKWLTEQLTVSYEDRTRRWLEWLKQGRLRIIKETPNTISSTTV